MDEIPRSRLAVYAVLVVGVVLLGGRALRAEREVPVAALGQGGGAGAPFVAEPGGGPTGSTGAEGLAVTSADEARVVVHVAGRVRRPGLYELRASDRVGDAIARAGGMRAGAASELVNLAAKLSDGQQVLVAARAPQASAAPDPAAAAGPAVGGGGAVGAAASPGPIDLNTATAEQLETLPGVGPAIAAKILAYRTERGRFSSVDELAEVSGIGAKRLEALRPAVRV